MASKKWVRLTPQAQIPLLTHLLQQQLAIALPITIQNAQIPVAVVQPYLAKLVPELAGRMAQGLTVAMARHEACISLSEVSNMLQAALKSVPNAVAGNMRSQATPVSAPAVQATPVAPVPAAATPLAPPATDGDILVTDAPQL